MTRLGVLRLGYGAIGASFAALALSTFVGALLFLGLALAFVGGVLLAFSDDDLPKWAGLSILGYFLLTALAFVATTPVTIDRGSSSYYFAPPDLANMVLYLMGLVSPFFLAGAGTVAAWERERPARLLLTGAIVGFVLVAAFTMTLSPDVDPACAADPEAEGCAGATERAAAQAQQQGVLIGVLFALSGVSGAAGAAWAAARPQEID